MEMRVGRASHLGVAIGGVALIVALSVASPAQADSCSITGTFGFTVTGGTGLLFLSTDGAAEMDLLPGPTSRPPGIGWSGTIDNAAREMLPGAAGTVVAVAPDIISEHGGQGRDRADPARTPADSVYDKGVDGSPDVFDEGSRNATPAAPAIRRCGCVSRQASWQAPAPDDEQERSVRLLLLGEGAVLAHRFDRPLAAEMDDDQQSDAGARRHRDERLR